MCLQGNNHRQGLLETPTSRMGLLGIKPHAFLANGRGLDPLPLTLALWALDFSVALTGQLRASGELTDERCHSTSQINNDKATFLEESKGGLKDGDSRERSRRVSYIIQVYVLGPYGHEPTGKGLTVT